LANPTLRQCATVVRHFMENTITSNFNRLGLHDSYLIKVVRHEQELELTFDWSYLENYTEHGINEAIRTGKITISLIGVHSETFKITNDKEILFTTPSADDLIKNIDPVNSSEIDDITKTFLIDGLYHNGKVYDWLEWCLKFDTCSISWNSFITNAGWLSGQKVPD
jgi:hypothetical protein